MAVNMSINTRQKDQSIINNYTVLEVDVNISWTNGSWDHSGSAKYVTIDGNTYYFSSEKINPNRTASGSQTIYAVRVVIYHDPNGEKTVGIYARMATATESGIVTASASPKLSTIPRTSPATLSASSVTTGESFIVYTNRHAAFTHTIKVTLGEKIITKTGVGDSVEITIPRDWATALPEAASGTATVVCTTDGIGSVTKNITVNVNSADIPTLAKVTATPHNENSIVAGWGIYLQGYSAIQIAFNTMSGVQGSTITGYKIKYGNTEITASPYRTPVINLSGTQKIYCYVKDSRDRWSEAKEVSVDCLSYAKPSLSGADSYRSDSSGTRQEQKGTYITAFAKAVFSSCNNKNSATLKCRYGLKTGSYGNYESMTSGVKKITGGGNIAVSKSYKVELLLTDALGNKDSAEFEISTKKVAISIMDAIRGAAIGKIAEKEGMLELAFDTEAKKFTAKNGINPAIFLEATGELKSRILKNVTSEGDYGTFLQDYGANGSSSLRVANKNEAIESRIQFVNTPAGGSNTYYNLLGTHNVADYVIEKGTKGIWTYVKWNDGRIEMWGDRDSSFPAGTSIGNGQYRSVLQLNLSAYMKKLIDGKCLYQNTGMIPQITRHGTNLNWAEIIIVRPATIAAFSAKLPLHFTGLWK